MENETKKCPRCGFIKSAYEFSKSSKSKDGLQPWCKACYKAYYKENQETILSNARNYIRENHAEILLKKKQYRNTHPAQIVEGRKRFRAANREKLIQADRLYYETNKAEILEQQKEKRIANPEILLFRNAKGRARDASVPFTIEVKDIVVPDICPILWIPLTVGSEVLHDGSPTLDRRTPELGYVKGNIAVLSHRANTIKNNGTADEHRLIADWMEGKSNIKFQAQIAEKKHAKMLIDHARKRAADHGLPFELRQKDILIPNVCPILGIPLRQGKKRMQESSPTIDRRVPEKGSTRGNIAIISLRANQIKSYGTAEEHRKIADWMDSWPNNPSE